MVKKFYSHTERIFERLAGTATYILGNSITFMIALIVVVIWLVNKLLYAQSIDDALRDFMHGFIFLSLFIIQKSFNRFSAILHLKVNELVVSHEGANNSVIDVEQKSEKEIAELSKEYTELIDKLEEIKP
ncbi:MAG: low affinity iron permease family protein [Bacteroidetes bacterium]|nr:low affinity iron permease family protein [Bacteroidota bacterium]